MKRIAFSSLLLATSITPALANTNSIIENTGDKLTNITDNVYASLTGKKIQTIRVNHPVSLLNYTAADSSYEDAYLNGSLNVNDSRDTHTSYDLKLGANYEQLNSTQDNSIKYTAGIDGMIAEDGDDNTDRLENYEGYASVTYNKYIDPNNNLAFWYGSGQARVQQEQGDDYAGLSNPEINILGGVGYGRVVNVTPMAKTMRLVEALIENGNLQQVPSANTYHKIAAIIDKEKEYRKKFNEKANQYWIGDIQKALGINLSAAGTIRAYDVLTNEKVSTRKRGWDVRAGIGLAASNLSGNSGNPLLEVQGNYYYPISNKTQFSNEASLSAELDDDDGSYRIANNMAITYELTDKVDWENKWGVSYQNNESAEDVVHNSLSSSFNYELSNSLDYKTTLQLNHSNYEHSESDFDKALFMGITYRLK